MNAAPPKISRPNPGFRFTGIVLGAMASGIAALIFFFNPATHQFYPVCQFHRLTGLNCPGCGMTRALYALLHGDVGGALHDNALLVMGMVAFPVRGLWLVLKKSGAGASSFFPLKWLWPLLVFALIFTILRNLPLFAFLSPQ